MPENEPKRRQFLAACSTFGMLWLSGCSDDSDSDTGAVTDGDATRTETDGQQPTRDEQTATDTDEAEPDGTGVYETPPSTAWARSYTGTKNAVSVVTVSDGYVIAGGKETGGYVAGIDAGGEQTWRKKFGSSAVEFANDAVRATDQGVVVTGPSETDAGNQEFRLTKYQPDGTDVWSRTYGVDGAESPNAVTRTNDGSFLLVGFHQPPDAGTIGTRIVKTDPAGELVWDHVFPERRYGNPAVTQLSNGDLIVVGNSGAVIGGPELLTARLSPGGDVLDEYTTERSGDVRVTDVLADDGYVVAGVQDESPLVLRFESPGTVAWEETFEGQLSQTHAESLVSLPDGGYVVGGGVHLTGTDTANTQWLAELSNDGAPYWVNEYTTDTSAGGNARLSSLVRTDDALVAAGDVKTDGGLGTNAYLTRFE